MKLQGKQLNGVAFNSLRRSALVRVSCGGGFSDATNTPGCSFLLLEPLGLPDPMIWEPKQAIAVAKGLAIEILKHSATCNPDHCPQGAMERPNL
jgi:hypothetical protein